MWSSWSRFAWLGAWRLIGCEVLDCRWLSAVPCLWPLPIAFRWSGCEVSGLDVRDVACL